MGDVITLRSQNDPLASEVADSRTGPDGFVFETYEDGELAIYRPMMNGEKPLHVDPYLYFETAEDFYTFVDFVLILRTCHSLEQGVHVDGLRRMLDVLESQVCSYQWAIKKAGGK